MEKNYGQMMVEGFVRAIPWAVVFSAALVLSAGIIVNLLKQDVKEAVEYTAKTMVHQSVQTLLTDPALNRDLLPKVKQIVKEGIEYTVTTANHHPIAVYEGRAGAKK